METAAPLHVTLVLTPSFPLLSLSICTESLRVANRELSRAVFAWTVATADGAPATSSSGLELAAAAALSDIPRTSIAIVLSSYNPEAACAPALLNWLRRQDRQGAEIACVDTAAYILGRAGLLRGRRVAVHPETVPAYREVLREARVVDSAHALDGRLASSAGGMATMEMMLDLIERRCGAEQARRVATVLTFRRRAEAAGESGEATIPRIDRRLGRLIGHMRANLETPLPLAELCRLARLDPSTARRLCVKWMGASPGRYYMELRLDRARHLLANSALPIAAVATMTGFADSSSFGRAYRRRFGARPSASRYQAPGASSTQSTAAHFAA